MGAAVRIEASVWTDPRFDRLARALGCDRDAAVGRMARVWSLCTEQQSHVLDPLDVAVALKCDDDDVVRALCDKANLAEHTPDGLRIRGTAGRIEWLGMLRQKAVTGGRARAQEASRNGGKFVSNPTEHQPGTSPAPARHQPATSPTATATATATAPDNPPLPPRGKSAGADGGGRVRNHVAHQLGAAVTRWLAGHIGKRLDHSSKAAEQAGRKWKREKWGYDLVVRALELRVLDLRQTGNGHRLVVPTLYNGNLDRYIAMARNKVTDEQMANGQRGGGMSHHDRAHAELTAHMADHPGGSNGR